MSRSHDGRPDRTDSGYERATGYFWKEPKLRRSMAEVLSEAEGTDQGRLEKVARQFQK